MKIFKRNQLIVLVISLMLIVAGYLNFTENYNTVETSGVMAELGDATLVNAEPIANAISSENLEGEIAEAVTDEPNKIEGHDDLETLAQIAEDAYFTTSKLERESMYSQMLETYQEIYNNTNSTSEQKNKAIEEIAKINESRNSIMIAENLVKAKGFEDIVIFANSNSVSVIIKAEKLETEQIAQIQNIVSRELEVVTEQINISTK